MASVWFCSTIVPEKSWVVPAVSIPLSLIVMQVSKHHHWIGLMLMGAVFGVFLSFSIILLGWYVLWDGEKSPSFAIIAFSAVFFGLLILTAYRDWAGRILPLGRLQLIPLYTSLLGSVAIVQPINYLSYNAIRAGMIVNCDVLPKSSAYVFLGIVYGLMLIGLFFQLSFGIAIQREYINGCISHQGLRISLSRAQKMRILVQALKNVLTTKPLDIAELEGNVPPERASSRPLTKSFDWPGLMKSSKSTGIEIQPPANSSPRTSSRRLTASNDSSRTMHSAKSKGTAIALIPEVQI